MLLIETAIGLVATSAKGLNPLRKPHWYCIPCCQPKLHLLEGCVVSSRSGQAACLGTGGGLFTQALVALLCDDNTSSGPKLI